MFDWNRQKEKTKQIPEHKNSIGRKSVCIHLFLSTAPIDIPLRYVFLFLSTSLKFLSHDELKLKGLKTSFFAVGSDM